MPRRGDIYFADLDPTVGSEQSGIRPVVIVQNNIGNNLSPTLIIAPITTQKKASIPTHVPIAGITGLSPNAIALLEQVRAIDRQRLQNKLGYLIREQMWEIDRAFALAIGIAKIPNPPLLMSLCHEHAQYYYDSPDHEIRRSDMLQETKESCSLCQTRSGWDFFIWDK